MNLTLNATNACVSEYNSLRNINAFNFTRSERVLQLFKGKTQNCFQDCCLQKRVEGICEAVKRSNCHTLSERDCLTCIS